MKQLREIFDSHYDYKYGGKRHADYAPRIVTHNYHFNTPHDSYHVSMTHDTGYGDMSVDFSSEKGGTGISKAEGKDSHKVFGTVKHIVQQHVKNNPEVKMIHFVGSKDFSRTKLYNKITKQHGGQSDDLGNGSSYAIKTK